MLWTLEDKFELLGVGVQSRVIAKELIRGLIRLRWTRVREDIYLSLSRWVGSLVLAFAL